MAAIKGRQQRAGVARNERLHVRVDPALRMKAEKAAAVLGISLAAYVDQLLAREEVDETGRPVWWTDPVPSDQGVLPLAQSA
jgi:hypothetical protein